MVRPRKVVVKGVVHDTVPVAGAELNSGALVKRRYGRATYVFLCLDGDEAVLRNLHHPSSITPWPLDDFHANFLLVLP